MQYLNIRKAIGLFLALAFYIGGTHTALAVGTSSGTTISNTATVDYAVSGTGRSASDSVDFLVDNRVDLTVTGGTAIDVAPGSTGQVLVFTVDNTGNTAQGYQFTVEAPGTPVMTQPVSVYIDDPLGASPGSFDAGDPQYTVGTTGNFANLPAISAAFGGGVGLDHDNGGGLTQVTVFIVADTPVAAADGTSDTYHLIAQTLDAGTDTVTLASAGPSNSLVTADVVFADGTGTHTGAANYNGIHSASGTYTVATPQLTVAKTIDNVSDQFNATNGYEIPGAVVRYQIVITNTGSVATDAGSVVITDPIPANTLVCVDDTGSRCITADLPSIDTTGSSITGTTLEYSDNNQGSWVYAPGGNTDAEGADTTVTDIRFTTTGPLDAGESVTVTVGVVVQ